MPGVMATQDDASEGFIELEGHGIPVSLLEVIPESICREAVLLPIRKERNAIVFAVADASSLATTKAIDKLRLIHDCEIRLVGARAEAILAAINRGYGNYEERPFVDCPYSPV